MVEDPVKTYELIGMTIVFGLICGVGCLFLDWVNKINKR